ncbi:MAG: NAD+ synthase, partial [Gammaproteobacteria bacterium]
MAEKTTMRIVLAQSNLLVGDVLANTDHVIRNALAARDKQHADLIAFPELTLTSYPPEDLLLRPSLQAMVDRCIERLCEEVRGIYLLVGHPEVMNGQRFNTASLIYNGKVVAICRKHYLPNYSVFDEKRYFSPGDGYAVANVNGISVGVTICEDIWQPEPARQASDAGAELIININASPFHMGKGDEREQVVASRVQECGVPICYVNLVGGQDELVFDGESFVMDVDGHSCCRAPAFEEAMLPVDFSVQDGKLRPDAGQLTRRLSEQANVYQALVLGVRDYIEKTGFRGAIIGLSGGIDSALTLAIAVDAIGAERVSAVMMPSRYTADMSLEDARQEAEALGVAYQEISIEQPFAAFLDVLSEAFSGTEVDTTEENIQARCRGVILMALSNKQGQILLTTGNKSEMSVGYATLYGDMAGGFAPIKDIPKLLVYRLSEYRNSLVPVIPQRVIERPPSAELAADQKDEDSLPPYTILDPLLEGYIENDRSIDE